MFPFPGDTRREQIAKQLFHLLSNDIVNRSVAFELRRRMGLTSMEKSKIVDAIIEYLSKTSTPDGYIETIAHGAVSQVFNDARNSAFSEYADEIDRYQYSAVLDGSCEVCIAADGMESANEEDLPPVPNPDCLGGMRCRCIHVAILKSEVPSPV